MLSVMSRFQATVVIVVGMVIAGEEHRDEGWPRFCQSPENQDFGEMCVDLVRPSYGFLSSRLRVTESALKRRQLSFRSLDK